MSKLNKPAFPLPSDFNSQIQTGMTMREHYAGLAMQGLINQEQPDFTNGSVFDVAESAVAYADALIAELSKK